MTCNTFRQRTLFSTTSAHGCPVTSNTYAHCGDVGTPCRDIYSSALTDKGELQNLNDRLANYLQKLRGMQQQPNIDPSKYREAMQMLENEMNKMKAGYEDEINRLRRALDDCCREKNALAVQANQCGTSLSDLQSKVTDLQRQLDKALADNRALTDQLANKDKDIADLRACLKGYQNELETIKPDYNRLMRDTDDYKRRLECEMKARADEDCRLKGLLDKCSFDANKKDEQIRDLQGRLNAANDIISSLEAKIKQLSNNDGSQMNVLLQKMRDDMAAEMRRQQQASEDALNKSLQALRCQIDTEARDKEVLARDNANLQDVIQQLKTKISDLEGRLTACCTENAQLKSDLERERTCSQQEIRNLEQKLRELQKQLMDQVKECSQARDQQMSLKTEIGNYRMLIDAADAKLNQQPTPPACAPPPYPTVRRPVTAIPACTAQSTSFCPPVAPAEVLGKSFGSCDPRRPPQTQRFTCDQFAQRSRGPWASTRITAEFKPVINDFSNKVSTNSSRTFSTRPW